MKIGVQTCDPIVEVGIGSSVKNAQPRLPLGGEPYSLENLIKDDIGSHQGTGSCVNVTGVVCRVIERGERIVDSQDLCGTKVNWTQSERTLRRLEETTSQTEQR